MNAFKIIYHPLIVHAPKILVCTIALIVLATITATCRVSEDESKDRDKTQPVKHSTALANGHVPVSFFCAIQSCLKQQGRFIVRKEQRKDRTMAATGFSEPPL